MNARSAALNILCQQEESGQPLDMLMEQQIKKENQADTRDTNLTMALAYGVLRQRRYLDDAIATFAKHPLRKMKPKTLQALRIGVYQLLCMERIPASAAINETVQALKKAKQPKWLINFVNGVLRNVARNMDQLLKAKKGLPPAVRESHPDWLYKRWSRRYGDETALEICRSNNSLPILTLRLNRKKISLPEYMERLAGAGIQAKQSDIIEEALHLAGYKGAISALPGYDQGFFHIQDEAAQLIVSLFQPFEPGRYLDSCAGLGGKTIQLAELLPGKSTLTAVEPNKTRLRHLQENLTRMNFSADVSIFQGGIESFQQKGGEPFTHILVDAPCSGLGVIRRHPDIRWNRRPEDLLSFQKKQLSLLQTAVAMLAPGGILVYATCSMEPEENDEVIRHLLKNQPEMSVEQPAIPAGANDFLDEQNFLRTLPAQLHDGFFATKLRKK
ncbi:MAG: 16S rRNA (cytosine(967)-C(5))-methyltransferase RsmB [Thermodesulfobacteriota bacterium]|nr:16S rRNA (cytosine(967)-C(5))-methyltransferase RsmB [Thermodesulfobacteriota bacterium]